MKTSWLRGSGTPQHKIPLQATALTISSSVADRWVEIIETRQQLSLLDRQVKTNRTQLELVELRFQNSQASELDVLQQRQTVARTQSQVPTAEASLEFSRHALNLLPGIGNITIPRNTLHENDTV